MARRDNESTDDDGRSGASRLTWILSGAIAFVVVLILVLVLVFGKPGGTQPAGAGTPVSTGTPSASATNSSKLPDGWKPCSKVPKAVEDDTVESAPATEWRDLDGMMLPTTSGGPFKYDVHGNVTLARCYAPNALGALTALAQIELRASFKPGGKEVRQQQTMPDTTLQRADALAKFDSKVHKPWPQIAGFKFESPIVDNNVAITTQLYFNETDQSTTPITWELHWTGTDWKVGDSIKIYDDDPNAKVAQMTGWSET